MNEKASSHLEDTESSAVDGYSDKVLRNSLHFHKHFAAGLIRNFFSKTPLSIPSWQ
jgi:hypothetical protein